MDMMKRYCILVLYSTLFKKKTEQPTETKMDSFLMICVTLVAIGVSVDAVEEVHTFDFKYQQTRVRGVVDLDADENWLSHHIFATALGPGVTIARDHDAGIEVFRYDGDQACYARPIQKSTRSVWEFKSMLEIEEEHHFNLTLPRRKLEEFLECTGKLVPSGRLGKVAYLCRGFPVYWLRKTREPLTTEPGQEEAYAVEEEVQGRIKRDTFLSAVRVRDSKCGFCISCCKKTEASSSLSTARRRKRDLIAVEACTRLVWIKGCSSDGEAKGDKDEKPFNKYNEKDVDEKMFKTKV